MDMMDRQNQIADAIRELLLGMTENLNDENFTRTPERVAKFYLEFFRHKVDTPATILAPTFETGSRGIVMQHGISFVSLCAHHLLPFKGTAAVAYVPNDQKRSVGLSKLSRIVHHFARRLTLQETVTRQVADALEEVLRPKGVMVVLEGEHQCMSIRGVQEPHARTVTSEVRGCFFDDEKHSKTEFLAFLGRSH